MTGLFAPLETWRHEGTSIEITRQLLDYLLSGKIHPGERLPPERKLAESFGVGRSVVREALRSLTLLGLLEVRLGDGTYVKQSDAEILPSSIEWGLVLGARHVLDLLEVYCHLGVILAGLAAQRRDERDVADLRETLAVLKATRREPSRFADAETAFLRAVTETGGNAVLAGTVSTIRSLLGVWVSRVAWTPEIVGAVADRYTMLIDAIAAGDVDTARLATGLALDQTSAQVRLVLSYEGRPPAPESAPAS